MDNSSSRLAERGVGEPTACIRWPGISRECPVMKKPRQPTAPPTVRGRGRKTCCLCRASIKYEALRDSSIRDVAKPAPGAVLLGSVGGIHSFIGTTVCNK
jgi:hypothetical protein